MKSNCGGRLLAGALVILAGCGDGTDENPPPPPPSPTLGVALDPNALSLTAGSSGAVTVNLTRGGGFTGAVDLTVEGTSANITGTFNPSTVTSSLTSSALTINTTAAAALGNTSLTVRARGTGVADATAVLTLTVNQAPASGNVSYSFACAPAALVPIWFGRQDGNGPWLPVTASASKVFTLDIQSGKGAVAWVTGTGEHYALTVHMGSTEELATLGQSTCPTNAKTILGSVGGMAGTDLGYITMGGASSVVNAGSGSGFTLTGVPDGPRDLVASRVTAGLAGQIAKLIVRRGINVPSGSTLPLLNFGDNEAFDPSQANLTVNNIGGENAQVAVGYVTSNSPFGLLFTETTGTPNGGRTWRGVPGAHQVVGDLHAIVVTSSPPAAPTPATQRVQTLYSRDVADRTITLGNLLTTPTVTTSLNVSYIRFRVQTTIQGEYNKGWMFNFAQGQLLTNSRNTTLLVMPGYLTSSAAGAAFDVSLPDFLTGASGFNGFWGPLDDVVANWIFTGNGWSGVSPISDGGTSQSGLRSGSLTP